MQLFRSREPDRAVCTWQHNGPRAPRIAAYLSFEHDGMSTRRTVLVQLQPGGKRPFAEFSTGQGLPFLRRLRVPKGAAMAALCGRTLLCILACCTVCAVVMPAAALTAKRQQGLPLLQDTRTVLPEVTESLRSSGGAAALHLDSDAGAGRHLLQQAAAGSAAAARRRRAYLSWVHGELMIIVYVGLIPFSILTAYTRRTTSSCWWFQIHRAVNVLAWLLQLASVGIKCWGLKMSSLKGERLVLVHVCVGIALQVLIGVQALIALLFRPSHDSKLRQTWSVIHRWLGWMVALVALAQLGGGMLLGHRPARDYWASFGVLVFWYLSFVALDLYRAAQLPPPAYMQSPAKVGRGGNGNMELLGRSQEPPQTAGDVPNVGGYRDAPESAGLVAAAMGGTRRAAREPRSDGV